MEISEEDTSRERILAFLELTGDTHPIHRDPKNMFPGMFYLALSVPYLEDLPLRSLDLRFKRPVTYPCLFNLRYADIKGGREITAFQNGTPLYLGRFTFQEEAEQSQTQVLEKKVEEFAKILGIKINHQNLEKIWLTCLLPKKLLDFFEGQLGWYMRQRMEFKGSRFDNPEIDLKLVYRKSGGHGIVYTNYKAGEDIVAKGQAFLMPESSK